jgi:hypothetical protein
MICARFLAGKHGTTLPAAGVPTLRVGDPPEIMLKLYSARVGI